MIFREKMVYLLLCFLILFSFFRYLCKPRSKLMVAVDVLRRYMTQFGFGLFDGSVHKKAPDSKFTFVYCSTVNIFFHHILGNPEIADHIASHVTQLASLLSVQSCRLIKPITLDYNFIEVLPYGTCFNIEKKNLRKTPRT